MARELFNTRIAQCSARMGEEQEKPTPDAALIDAIRQEQLAIALEQADLASGRPSPAAGAVLGRRCLTEIRAGAKKCIKENFPTPEPASMAAALLSPGRTKGKRRWVRRPTSGRTIYAYVDGNPISFVDPLGLQGARPGRPRNWWSNFQKQNGGGGLIQPQMRWIYRQIQLQEMGRNRDLLEAGENAPDPWGGAKVQGCDAYFCNVEVMRCACPEPNSCPNPSNPPPQQSCPCSPLQVRVISSPG